MWVYLNTCVLEAADASFSLILILVGFCCSKSYIFPLFHSYSQGDSWNDISHEYFTLLIFEHFIHIILLVLVAPCWGRAWEDKDRNKLICPKLPCDPEAESGIELRRKCKLFALHTDCTSLSIPQVWVLYCQPIPAYDLYLGIYVGTWSLRRSKHFSNYLFLLLKLLVIRYETS